MKSLNFTQHLKSKKMKKTIICIAVTSLLATSCSNVIEQYETETQDSQLMKNNMKIDDETQYAEEGEPTVLGK